MRVIITLLLGIGACAGNNPEPSEDAMHLGSKADDPGSFSAGTYVSASSLAALRATGDPAKALAGLRPPFRHTFPNDATQAWEYLKPLSGLGFFGPLGPYGSLGRNGPVGFRYANPS